MLFEDWKRSILAVQASALSPPNIDTHPAP